jgi:aminoacylase
MDYLFSQAFMAGARVHGLEIDPQIFPAGNDARFLRQLGIPAFGFSPMNNTPVILNQNLVF